MGKIAVQNDKDLSDIIVMHWLAVVGFSCLIGWELLTVFAPGTLLLDFMAIEEAVVVRLISVLTLVISFVVLGKEGDWCFINRNKLIIAGACFSVPSVVVAIAGPFFAIPFFLVFAAWFLLGFGQAFLAQYWCTFFSLVPTGRTMRNIVFGGMGGTVCYGVAAGLGPTWAGYSLAALLLIAAVVIAYYLMNIIPPDTIPDVSEFHSSTGVNFPAFFSIASCGAVYGFMTIVACSLGPLEALIGGCSGIFGVLLSLVWYRLGAKVEIDIDIVQRISLPLLVASLLLSALSEGPLRMFFICISLAALAHNQMFNWYSISIGNKEFRMHPIRRYARRAIPCWVGFFVGCCVAYYCAFGLHLEGAPFFFVEAVFVVVLVTAFSIYGGNQSTRREQLNDLIDVAGQAAVVVGSNLSTEKHADDAVPEVTSESYADHCAAVAEQYSLTPRESEVFMCLARGRNAEYIANQLMVSPATVKSHIYHIYQKLGVNSQQRLMDLVEGGEPQEP